MDLFAIGAGPAEADRAGLASCQLISVVPRPEARTALGDWARWLVAGKLPYSLWLRDYSPVADRFAEVRDADYSLCWISTLEPFHALRGRLPEPTILDLFDLEDHKERTLREATPAPLGRRMRSLRNEALWRRLQDRAVRSVSRVVVCSELDRRRLGAPNAVVIPNGYELEGEPAGASATGAPPTVLFVGFLRYEPNLRAARFLARTVAPRVWALLPDVHFRIVGDAPEEVRQLASDPRITVTGRVVSMEEELRRGSVSVVPLRSGSGTRIKILEAFAHRIPVVSTRLGAEGLDIEPGKHLLLAESAEELASSIVSLLRNEVLRESIVSAAHDVYQRSYRWRAIRDTISSLARGTAADR